MRSGVVKAWRLPYFGSPEGLAGPDELNGNLRRERLDPLGHFQHPLLFGH